MSKHRKTTGFTDHVADRYRALVTDYARARHRAPGPPNIPTIYEMTADEMSQIKGAGPRY